MDDFFDKDTILESNRLILRYLDESDKEDIFKNIVNNKNVLKYYLWDYRDNIDDFDFRRVINRYYANNMYAFSIVLKETGEVIGLIHQCNTLSPKFPTIEIGYAIGEAHWNKGYTTEALQLFVDFLKTKKVHKITASHIKENAASGRVMQHVGMKYEYESVESIFYHDKYHDVLIYYLINENY